MTPAASVARAQVISDRRWAWTAAAAVAAVAFTMAIALTNQPYFELVNGWVRADEPVARGAVYSSYLLLIGLAVVVWRPGAFCLGVGETFARWRLVGGSTVGMAALTMVVLTVVSGTPYANARWENEVVIVPLTEELVFRGVLFSALLAAMRRLHPPATAAALAIGTNAIAFALGHATNLFWLPGSFVLPQVAYAGVIGVVAAFVMLRTRSVYPAMLVHAAVNAVVVAF
jgi:membrane protease YdiL (CAAX protease family)